MVQYASLLSDAMSIEHMVGVHRLIVCVLRSENDPKLESLANSLEAALQQLEAVIEAGGDKQINRRIATGLRQGLREFPLLLRSLVPEKTQDILDKIRASMNVKAT